MVENLEREQQYKQNQLKSQIDLSFSNMNNNNEQKENSIIITEQKHSDWNIVLKACQLCWLEEGQHYPTKLLQVLVKLRKMGVLVQ